MSSIDAVDVCFIYEQNSKYQGRHVRAWIEQLTHSIPSTKFAVIAIHSSDTASYTQGKNSEERSHYLSLNIDIRQAWGAAQKKRINRRAEALPAAAELLRALHSEHAENTPHAIEKLQHQLDTSADDAYAALLHSEPNWHMLRNSYTENAAGQSFQEYFHLSRALLLPLYALSEQARSLPVASCYHALNLGYAGYLGALLQQRHKTQLISSKLGNQIQFKYKRTDTEGFTPEPMHTGPHADLWLRLREAIRHISNHRATAIVATSRYQLEARQQELEKEKPIHLIRHGIDTDHFSHLFAQHAAGPPPVIATLGAVAPAQDIKGFIRAIASLREQLPHVVGWVVGSLTFDTRYSLECQSLVRNLGLYNHVRFFGEQDEDTIYPRIGALVVNTLADTPPPSLQHAQAAGVPVIATDVGACRELLEGLSPEDKELGLSGVVVPAADPVATARAAVQILQDQTHWEGMRLAGIERCKRYYTLDTMLQSYRTLYQSPSQAV